MTIFMLFMISRLVDKFYPETKKLSTTTVKLTGLLEMNRLNDLVSCKIKIKRRLLARAVKIDF